MNNTPFLTQFKKERITDPILSSIEIKYDDGLGYNIISNNESNAILTSTSTRVKAEQPDELNCSYNDLLMTQTLTDVKKEQPDQIDESFFLQFMATNTATNTKVEKLDSDY